MSRAGTPLDEKTEQAIFGAMHAYITKEACDCPDYGPDCKHVRAYRTARDRLRDRFLQFAGDERKRCASVVRTYRDTERFPVQRQLLRAVAQLVEKEPTKVAKLTATERRRAERGACIKCGCTDHRACDEGCYWVSTNPPICSSCA